jgi:HD superfamily phosphohydrolase
MKHIHVAAFLIIISAISCNLSGKNSNTDEVAITDTTQAPPETALSLIREQVDTKPVAQYSTKVTDDLNDWYFKVQLYQTEQRYTFKVSMQYQEVTGEDVIIIPNLGKEPKVELRPGSEKYSCTIGFLDKEGKFREYKEVSVQNESLKMTTLKSYTVTVQ